MRTAIALAALLATAGVPEADPRWDWQSTMRVRPLSFEEERLRGLEHRLKLAKDGPGLSDEKMAKLKELIRNKLSSRLGWQPRCKPLQLPSGRLLLPLYSDTYSVSLIALSDDDGKPWTASKALA